YYSVNTGSGWSEPAPVNEHPAVDDYPDLAVDGEGRVWCVWESNRDEHPGIWASYTPFTGVEEPVTHQLPSFKVEPHIGETFNFYVLSQVIPGKLEIYDAAGRMMRQLQVGASQKAFWDGRDQEGKALPNGVYFVRCAQSWHLPSCRLVLVR
ncbi:hypothetical protein JXM67_14260, partial [candidate division WOR-3 bacterium]|nr:hypothetical protein [candidate division WOR-3 bacterium]